MNKAIPEHPLEWMPKSVWGPIKWTELHCRGLLHRGMEGEEAWFKSFVESLPCDKCKHHFQSFIQQFPPDFSSRSKFFEWTVSAHNFVNRALRKPEFRIEHVVAKYSCMLTDQN